MLQRKQNAFVLFLGTVEVYRRPIDSLSLVAMASFRRECRLDVRRKAFRCDKTYTVSKKGKCQCLGGGKDTLWVI